MNFWVVKCKYDNKSKKVWHWRDYLKEDCEGYDWGGKKWIRSKESQKYIKEGVRKGDIIVCSQRGEGILGFTTLTGDGKEKSKGSGVYNILPIASSTQAFALDPLDPILQIPELKQTGCNPKCFMPGRMGTVFPLDMEEFKGIIDAIIKYHPEITEDILKWLKKNGFEHQGEVPKLEKRKPSPLLRPREIKFPISPSRAYGPPEEHENQGLTDDLDPWRVRHFLSSKAGNKTNNGRQCWLWVTRPEFYLDDDGSERSELDPSSKEDLWGSWTCHKDTKKGDLALLWRSRKYLGKFLASKGTKTTIGPKSDIAFLFQVSDDAYLTTDEKISTRGWSYGCKCVPVYKFRNPLTISEIKANPYLREWNALKGKFEHSAFRISIEDWKRLNKLLLATNHGYKSVLRRVQEGISSRILTEEKIEKRLVNNLRLLKPFGYNLKIYEDAETGKKGRQLVCSGAGIIDLLCYDGTTKKYVVIEIKNVRANENTFGQISKYVGWVKKNISRKVKGLVISRGMDMQFGFAMKANPNVSQLNIEKLGFK